LYPKIAAKNKTKSLGGKKKERHGDDTGFSSKRLDQRIDLFGGWKESENR
jgi:hypothetical protein